MKNWSKRGGFTLLELMVVVIIIGVLSAVAVPKLFGHMAKAKASEIYGAAGAYISAQDAYNTEFPDSLGSWAKIGYSGPISNNFRYLEDGKKGGSKENKSRALSSGMPSAWQAQNNALLNNCNQWSTWQIDVVKGNADDDNDNASSHEYRLVYQVSVTDGPGGACAVLTPNIAQLSTQNTIKAYINK